MKDKNQVPNEALMQKIFLEQLTQMTITALKVITLIEQVDDEKFLRQRELFWAHKLDIIYPMA